MSAKSQQVGGTHYTSMAVQPWDVIDTWPIEQQIGYYRGNVLKYTMRMGLKDIAAGEIGKAQHYAQKLLEVMGKAENHIPDAGKMIYSDNGYTEQDMQAASLVHDAAPSLGSCHNCSRAKADGWALMCVDCAIKAFSNETKQTKCNDETCAKEAKPAQTQADSETRKGNDALDSALVELCSNTTVLADVDGWVLHVGNECPVSDLNTLVECSNKIWASSEGKAGDMCWADQGSFRPRKWRYAKEIR